MSDGKKASDFEKEVGGRRWVRRDGKLYSFGEPLPEGPWHDEPDRLEWTFAGMTCLAVRGPFASWCGYVAVPPGHPWHGQGLRGLDARVHGGITYARECQGEICHEPKPGEAEDLWWVGFDCGHAFDLMPTMEALNNVIPALREIKERFPTTLQVTYKPLSYVKRETERLARQAKDAK